MENSPFRLAGLFVLVSTMLTFVPPMAKTSMGADASEVPEDYLGRWKGRARIIVGWTEQRYLPIDIKIHPTGNVEGNVGDATLVNGKLKRKSWVYTKIFRHTNPYRTEGDLQGKIIGAEGLVRDSIHVGVAIEDGRILGGLATSGTKTGGKESMILSAVDLSLDRIQETER